MTDTVTMQFYTDKDEQCVIRGFHTERSDGDTVTILARTGLTLWMNGVMTLAEARTLGRILLLLGGE